MNVNWKDGEFAYCEALVHARGNRDVGGAPQTIAAYLRLQASSAFSDGEFELSARLAYAATAINEDARNAHTPNWAEAERVLAGPAPAKTQYYEAKVTLLIAVESESEVYDAVNEALRPLLKTFCDEPDRAAFVDYCVGEVAESDGAGFEYAEVVK